jgi:hypothetical protein
MPAERISQCALEPTSPFFRHFPDKSRDNKHSQTGFEAASPSTGCLPK